MMNIRLKIQGEDFHDEALQNLTEEICLKINRETDFQASLKESENKSGTKGEPIAIGEIILAVLGTGGAAVALINVFKSFVERSSELSVKLKKQNGGELEINSKNINSNEIKSIIDGFLRRD